MTNHERNMKKILFGKSRFGRLISKLAWYKFLIIERICFWRKWTPWEHLASVCAGGITTYYKNGVQTDIKDFTMEGWIRIKNDITQ